MANGSFHGDLLSDHKTTIVSLTHQMIAVHNAVMETMRLARPEGQSLEARRHYVNCATRMMQLFLAQMAAFKKYRGKTRSR